MGFIDLHIHTTASDGTDTPAQVAEEAARLGLCQIAITDHDTMSGVAEARRAGEKLGLSVVGGIELSTDYRGEELHLLGYYLAPDAPGLLQVMDWNRESRLARNRRMVEKLHEAGCPISLEALEEANPGAVLGRPHIGEALVGCGWADSVGDAFRRYLSPGAPYYLPREKLPFHRGVAGILEAGGLPVLAHPLQYGFPQPELEQLTAYAAGLGVVGMEVYYSGYTQEDTARLLALARRHHLLPTGGSDYHGTRKPDIHLGTGTGTLHVPAKLGENLYEAWKTR
jgi:hypothetical protein